MHDLYITNLMVVCFMYTVIVLSLFYMFCSCTCTLFFSL